MTLPLLHGLWDVSRAQADTTLFGRAAALLGVGLAGEVCVVQPLQRHLPRDAAPTYPIPVIGFEDRHPRVSLFAPQTTLADGFVYYQPEGGLPYAGRRLLDDTPQEVVGWVLVGLDPDNPADMDPLAPAQGGQGPLGLGADAQAAEQLALAEGRLWLRWEVPASGVTSTSALPLLFTSADGEGLRSAALRLSDVAVDPLNYASHAGGVWETAQLCLDVKSLLAGYPSMSVPDQLDQLGVTLRQLGTGLLEQAHGPDDGTDPLTTLPVPNETLFDIAPDGYPSIGSFRKDDGLTTASMDVVRDRLVASQGEVAMARHLRSFVLSEGRGLKVTLRVHGSVGTGAFSVGVCPVSSSVHHQAALLELSHNSADAWTPRVATFTGKRHVTAGWRPSVVFPDEIGRTLPPLEGQRYEAYVFPDRRAFVYANGVFIHALHVNEAAFLPGTEYTLRLLASGAEVGLAEARVESFSVPVDYLPYIPEATTIMLDGSRAAMAQEAGLVDGSTEDKALELGYGGDHIEFTLSAASTLSIHGTLQGSGGYPEGHAPRVILQRVDGLGSYYHAVDALDGWYQFPATLPAGRYRLRNYNGDWYKRYCARYHSRYYTRCVEWRYQHYHTNHVTTINEWRLEAPLPEAGLPEAPGPTALRGGDAYLGYYGEVPTEALIGGDGLAAMIGLTVGEAIFSGEPWLKFAHEGRTLYIAKKPFRRKLAWHDLDTVGAVFGREVTIGARRFKVRLLKGGDGNPSRGAGGEWDDLIYPVHEDDPTSTFWERFTDEDLMIASFHCNYNLCQEASSADRNDRVGRGYGTLTGYHHSHGYNHAHNYNGWRPVLELIE